MITDKPINIHSVLEPKRYVLHFVTQ